jgi:SAM-dependent methyltransferase
MSLTQTQIESKLRPQDLDELLDLWRTEQGAAKVRDLDLMAAAIPFPRDAALRVLDLGCGPGDVGRTIHARYPQSRIDGVDRDVFLISLCIGTNRREGVSGRIFVRDLWGADWYKDLERGYDVVATANALHWLDARRVAELCKEVFRLLRPGGVFLFVEPAGSEATFAAGFAEWKSRLPARYCRENWERFWKRANEILGYDHTRLLGARDSHLAGGEGLPVSGWTQFLKDAGFISIDVLLRDADEVMLAAARPGDEQASSADLRC